VKFCHSQQLQVIIIKQNKPVQKCKHHMILLMWNVLHLISLKYREDYRPAVESRGKGGMETVINWLLLYLDERNKHLFFIVH
jgi:hypothetical protein